VSTETWYVLEDGSSGDPRDVRPGPDGRLMHKDGRAVAYAPHGPRTRSVDPAEMSRDVTAADDREMKPAPSGRGYRTRGRS